MPDTKKKILIGEDEKPMARALELKLTNEGYEAHAVHNGNDVLEEIKKGGYDLLLLDLVMPQKDGFAVLKELKEGGNKVPVIVSSNLSQTEDSKKAMDLGAKDFFVKSNTPISRVVEHIKAVLNED